MVSIYYNKITGDLGMHGFELLNTQLSQVVNRTLYKLVSISTKLCIKITGQAGTTQYLYLYFQAHGYVCRDRSHPVYHKEACFCYT